MTLLPTPPVRALDHDVLELHGHRQAGVDLDAYGASARVGGVDVVGGLGAVEPDLEAVAACTHTQRIPLTFLEEGGDTFSLKQIGIR